MGRRDFEEAAIGLCREAVDAAGHDVENVSGREIDRLQRVLREARLEKAMAGLDDHRLFLHAVVLHGEALPRFDEEDFTDVVLGLCPKDLVAPRLLGLLTLGYQIFG
jgi:hypothetical protein